MRRQVMKLSYFPHIKVVHTSKLFHEQVYMPLANWLLMIGTVIVTAVYNNVSPLSSTVSSSNIPTRLNGPNRQHPSARPTACA